MEVFYQEVEGALLIVDGEAVFVDGPPGFLKDMDLQEMIEQVRERRKQTGRTRRIYWMRVHRGLTIRELARKADLSAAELSGIEHGKIEPCEETIRKILRALLRAIKET